jgi:hypothetical protein
MKVIAITALLLLAGALLVNGVRGIARRRVPTKLKRDVTGRAAMVVGGVFVATAVAVCWLAWQVVQVR